MRGFNRKRVYSLLFYVVAFKTEYMIMMIRAAFEFQIAVFENWRGSLDLQLPRNSRE